MIGVRSGDLKFLHFKCTRAGLRADAVTMHGPQRSWGASPLPGPAETPDVSPGFFPAVKSSGRQLVGHCPQPSRQFTPTRRFPENPLLGRAPPSRPPHSASGAGARCAPIDQTRARHIRLLGEALLHQTDNRVGLGDRIIGAIAMHRQSGDDDRALIRFDPRAAARVDDDRIECRRRRQQ
jgi:hypothetical protein